MKIDAWVWIVALVFNLARGQLVDFISQNDCPLGWETFADKCYKFDPIPQKLDAAKRACANDGASLVSVNSPSEHNFISNYIKDKKLSKSTDQWWTSGERPNARSTNFQWQGDGTKLEGQEFWLDPAIRATPGVVIVYATQDIEWGWSLADKVTGTGPFICEISQSEIFRITSLTRDFSYGREITDPTKFEIGPRFEEQPVDAQYDEDNNLERHKDVLVQYVEFECFASGNPIPKYNWYKRTGLSKILLDPLSDESLSITNGKLRISNPSTARQDFGSYQCEAENKFGSILSDNASLSFVALGDFSRDQRQPVRAGAYDFARLACGAENIAQGYDRLLYSWFKDGDSLNNNILPDSKPYTYISMDGTLHFSAVTKDDKGDYQCNVVPPFKEGFSSQGRTSQPIELIISEGTASQQDPKIADNYPRVWPATPLVGNEVLIECIAYGTGELQYQWRKVGSQLPASAQLLNLNRQLLIPKAELIHSGTYTCLCTSILGTDGTGQTAEENVVLTIQAAPVFTVNLTDEHVDKGGDLTWQCIAEGEPEVSYLWYRNSEVVQINQLNLDPKFQGRYTINQNVLKITDVTLDDAAMYQCSASNTHGTAYSSAQLRVISFAPSFTKYPLPSRQYATMKGRTTIQCSPEAAPKAIIEWRKDNRALNPSTNEQDNVHVLANGNLVINSVSTRDAGMYTCIATNEHGTAESSGELSVLATTTITTPPRDGIVEVNKTAFFHCEASFNPALDVTYDWYQNNRKIDFERIFIIGEVPYVINEPYFERGSGANKGGLYIRDVQYFHAGNYTCIAKTSSDSASRSAKLQVIGPPFPPVSVTYDDTFKNATALYLQWQIGIYSDNGRPIIGYDIEKMDEAKGYWEKADFVMTSPTEQRALVYGLSPYSTLKFRVRAINILGTGDPSAESAGVTTDPGKPIVPVTKIRRCLDKVGTLCIQWDCIEKADYDGPDFGYLVRWKESYIIDEQWDNERLTDAKTLRECKHVVLVGDKKYWQDYDVEVRGYNYVGDGPQSAAEVIKSSMGMPTALVTDATVWQFNATAILVEWRKVDDSNLDRMKGTVSGYRINYWRVCCEEVHDALFRVIPGQVDHGLIIGLYPNTRYAIEVQVFNEAGLGPTGEATVRFQETLRAAPKEAPQEVRVFVEGHDSVRLSWRGVDTTVDEEPLWGYLVLYWRAGENRNMATEHNAGRKSHTIIRGLQVNTLYYMRVAGYSRGGVGLLSSPTMQVILGPNCEVTEDSPDTRYVYRCKGDDYFESLYFNKGSTLDQLPLLLTLAAAVAHIVIFVVL